MPQLVTSTFPSQIFWVLLGFCFVYCFVSLVFTPKIEKVLRDREFYIDGFSRDARRLADEAEKLEKDSVAELENAQISASEAEAKLVSALREQNFREKELLYGLFSQKSKEESDLLIRSSEKVFEEVSRDMDKLVDRALAGISCSMRVKS